MCLHQVENPPSHAYHLPLQDEDVTLANNLWRALKAIKDDHQESDEFDLEESNELDLEESDELDLEESNKLDLQESKKPDLQESIGHLHKLFWSLCGSQTRVKEEALWTDPLKCFIAVLNLTKKGTFREASAVTSGLATWKHNLRAMVLHQIVLQKHSFSSQLE